jgi:hypothetical protein
MPWKPLPRLARDGRAWLRAAVLTVLPALSCALGRAAEPAGDYADARDACRSLGEQLADLRCRGLRSDKAERELLALTGDVVQGADDFWGHRAWRVEQQMKNTREVLKVKPAFKTPMPSRPFGVVDPESHGASRLAALAASAGFQSVRLRAPFVDPGDTAAATEAWRGLETRIDAWSGAGLVPLVVLDYGSTAPSGAQGWEAYGQWVEDTITRLQAAGGDARPAFAVQHEIDSAVDLGKPFAETPEVYAEMLRAAHETIRRAAPGAKVVLGSFRSAGPGLRSPLYFETLLAHTFDDGRKLTEFFDVAAIRHTPSAAARKAQGITIYDCLTQQVTRVRATLDAAGSSAPIWITDVQMPPLDELSDAGVQARVLAALALGAAISGAERAFFRGLVPGDGDAPENPTFFDSDLQPAPLSWAMADIVDRIGPASRIIRVELGIAEQFMLNAEIGGKGDYKDVYLVWSDGLEANVTIGHRVHRGKLECARLADCPPGDRPPEDTMSAGAVKLTPEAWWLWAPGQTRRN